MAEHNAAGGYAALGKQTVSTTAVTPALYVPYYKQSMVTDINLISDEPVYGNKFKRFQSLQGVRSHSGSLTVMAEPNTAAYWHDMLETKSSTTGSNPYTHVFGASGTTDPNYYTLDISFVSQVVRFYGVAASKLSYNWNGDKMELGVDVSGLGSFYGREIASISTNVLTLKTDYDPTPTNGLVASDLVKVTKIDGSSSTNYTVTSFTATTVTLSATAASFAAGDMLVLRAATPSLSLLTPFLWGKTQFFFAADAATALTNSATASNQTRLEPGTSIDVMHDFSNNKGEPRSGGFDPASLIRDQYDLNVKLQKFFDTSDEIKYWNALTKRAMLMRAYSGATNQYELRLTVNNMTGNDMVTSDSGKPIYTQIDYSPNYDQTDGQGFSNTVINAVATV